MAEAQKSTALVKPTRELHLRNNRASYEQNMKKHSLDKMSPKRNIIVEVETSRIDVQNVGIDENGMKGFNITNELIDERYDDALEPHLINRDLNSKYVLFFSIVMLNLISQN